MRPVSQLGMFGKRNAQRVQQRPLVLIAIGLNCGGILGKDGILRNKTPKVPAYDGLLRLHSVPLQPHRGYQFLNP